MSDAVKVVSDFPQRIEELFDLLQDHSRLIRGRAAATLARLVSLHPGRLLRFVPRLREALQDESAYVRWHLVYTLATLCELNPKRLNNALTDLCERLQDPNKVVRHLTAKALARSAFRDPGNVEELFRNADNEITRMVGKILKASGSKAR
jgi:HEAT repeat protein